MRYSMGWIVAAVALVGCATPRSSFAPLNEPRTVKVIGDFTLTNEGAPADLLSVSANQHQADIALRKLSEKLANKGFSPIGHELSCIGCAFTSAPYQLIVSDEGPQKTLKKAPFYFSDAFKTPEKAEALRN